MANNQAKEKAKEAQMKQLRQELEEKILEQLPQEMEGAGAYRNQKFEDREIRSDEEAKRVIEAVLFTASKPVTVSELRKIVKGYGAAKIEQILGELKAEYERDGRSFRVGEIAGGYEIATEVKYAPWIFKLELQKRAKQATQSALETLAILAYKQPMTKAEVDDLRGVDSSGVLSTLLERNLLKVVGRKEVPGRPFLYGTTEKFLEHFGLKSIQELPDISEIKTLVEGSIRKEDLLQQEKIVTVGAPPQNPSPPEPESNLPHES